MKHIIVATDFSEASERALRYSLVLAKAYGSCLELLHVVPDAADQPWADEARVLDLAEITESWLRTAQAKLRRFACRCRPLSARTAVRLGPPAEQILEQIAESHADLAAIGIANTGRARVPAIGSIAERLLRRAPCPVLAVPGPRGRADAGDPGEGWPRTILVPTDFSTHAHAALAYASGIAAKLDATLQVLHVVDLLWNEEPEARSARVDATEQARRQLEHDIGRPGASGVTTRVAQPLVAIGEPAGEILRCADRVAADLIIMGTHGRSQIGRFLLGSVTHEVLERTTRPVLVTHS